jgi:predicted O-methyltransferase YrrM
MGKLPRAPMDERRLPQGRRISPVLEEIIRTDRVRDHEGAQRPLIGPMSPEEGELIMQVFEAVKPDTSVETGFAYGVSTLFVCSALENNGKTARHIVIDPLQNIDFERIGLLNVTRAGYDRFVELREIGSEVGLPELYAAGTRIQVGLIDGYHTFDHTLIDFFYMNKMLDVGGVIIIDDVNMPAVARCVAHIASYPCYRLYGGTEMPRAPNPFVALRRRLNGTGLSGRHSRDNPSCVALQKISPDTRDWDWHVDF